MKRWMFALSLAILVAPSALQGQNRGTISGQVTDAATARPLVGAQVTVGGTNVSTLTNEEGRYLLINVPAGPREVRVSLIGYARGTVSVNVEVGQTATRNFTLVVSALELEGVIATATGQEIRRRELGNSVATINTDDIELAPVTNFTQLIQGRIPGATVMQSSGTVGGGARIRIRGLNSVSLSNAPLLIVDGIRVDNAERSSIYGVGGQEPSRFNDLNPASIESIEILKGPAAAALYGTAAANGVIQVTTKRGRAGSPQFSAWTEYGTSEEMTDFPDNWYAVGRLVGGAGVNVPPGTRGRCDNIRRAIGASPGTGEIGCTVVDSTYTFNPLENAETTPFRTGQRRAVGASLSGGGEVATFYVSGSMEEDEGVLPQNLLERINLQANMSGQVGENLRVGTNIGFLESDLELPQSDNALFGILGMGLYGDPRPAAVESRQGYLDNPQFFYDWITTQAQSRFTGSTNADWRPIDWLRFTGTVGLDRSARQDINRLPQATVYARYGAPYAGGFIQNSNVSVYNFTGGGTGTVIFSLSPDLTSTTSLGTQYVREDYEEIYAFGSQLTPGIEESLTGATSDFSVDEVNILNSTISAYMQEQLAWRDRVFLNASVRGDQNTAFGSTIDWIWYPAASASWVISEESMFPDVYWLSNLRLRAAFGRSGLRPGATDALQSFVTRINGFEFGDDAAVIISAVGNPNLKPEQSTEWEAGFEASLIDERIGAEVTYFNKASKDALVSRNLPPSLGSSAARFENLGEVHNSGWEGLLSLRPVTGDISWDINLSGSSINHELVDLGVDLQGDPIAPIIFGLNSDTQRHQEGHALGSWFQRPYTFIDVNGDGRLTPSEVLVADSAQFLGNPFPTREISLSSSISAFGWLRLSGLLDHKGGHQMMNFTAGFRCQDYRCADNFDDDVPLDRQAAIIALNTQSTLAGWVEDAGFWRLREVALTLTVPNNITSQFGSTGLNVTFAGRNLATWTDYSGFDPEVNFAGQANFSSGDAATLPPSRQLIVRVDANF